MSITSLTALASGDITDVRSSMMFIISSDTAYRVDLKDIYATYALQNVGAAWICNSAHTRSVFDTMSMSPICRSLAYDYDNFTDANSPGRFWIKSDKWAYIQLGMDMLFDASAQLYIAKPAINGVEQTNYYIHMYGPGQSSLCHFSVTVVLPVNSGDSLDWQNLCGAGTFTSVATDTSRIWIRGYRAN